MVAPEVREVLGHLDRAHAGREDVHAQRNAAHRDAWRLGDAEKFLDAKGDERRAIRFVRYLWISTVREGHTFGSVLVEQLTLRVGQLRFHHRFDVAILQVLVAHRTKTHLFDDVAAIVLAYNRKLKVRTPLREQVQADGPLCDGVIPAR